MVGWKTKHALSLLGPNPALYPTYTARKANRELRGLARQYLNWFRLEPRKTHVFPMVGAIFQYEFAKGVRDATGLKTRICTITPLRGKNTASYLQPQAERLGLSRTGVVLHDYIHRGILRNAIIEAASIPGGQMGIHKLAERQVMPEAIVPLFGGHKNVSWRSMFRKEVGIGSDGLAVRLGRNEHRLSDRERMFVLRACYAAGYAAAKELEGKKTR